MDIIDEFFIRIAIDLSRKSVERGGKPFGAILVRDGEIVSSSENQVFVRHDPTSHAAMEVIRNFCQETGITDLRDCTLYSSCEPCFMCSGAMVLARLGRLVYAASNRDLRAVLGEPDVAGNDGPPEDFLSDFMGVPDHGCSYLVFSNSSHKPIIRARAYREESLIILRNYFESKNIPEFLLDEEKN